MVPDKEWLRTHFHENPQYYQMMSQWHAEHGGLALEPATRVFLLDVLEALPDASKVLEMGCGEGSITTWVAEHYPKLTFIGTDISPVGIDIAKAKSRNIANLEFLTDDIEESKLEDASVSAILSQSVLEHLSDYKKALRECYRILQQGGVLLIRVGNGGRLGHGAASALRDLSRYLLRLNTVHYLQPTCDLSAGNDVEKTDKHQTAFDLVEIPSDILVRDLKRIGFKIRRFSTNRHASLLSDQYKSANWFKRKLTDAYIAMNVFPFSHFGRTTILVAEK